MTTVYVARSAKLQKWASDVGLSKHVYKLGCTDGDLKALVAAGWAGETDWLLLGKEEVAAADEAALIASMSRKEKMVDPVLYPKLKGVAGFFKIPPARVENSIIVTRALAGGETGDLKLKPADFAAYMIKNATGSTTGVLGLG
jgi:hypothetical protein